MRKIPSFPDYEISKEGHVFSRKTGKFLAPRFIGAPNPKLAVDLFRNGKRHTCYIHNLITLSFHGNSHPKQTGERNNNPAAPDEEKSSS